MALRLFNLEDFEAELRKRGCTKTEHRNRAVVAWVTRDGRHFLVPIIGDGHYPDWMLDRIIAQMRLPSSPLQ